jgi:hypothetical protein
MASIGGPYAIFILGTLTNRLMNPENYPVTIRVKEGDRTSYYFDERVTDNFSTFWFWMGMTSITIGLVITPLMKGPDDMFSMFEYIRGVRYEETSEIDAEEIV